MKPRLIKQKALFQIFLIITLTFYTSLSFAALDVKVDNPVNKENKITYFDLIKQDLLPSASADPGKVCCEKTKTDSEFKGQSCVFTEATNCDAAFKTSNVACPQTDFCAPVVCILNGICEDNVEKKLCEQKSGQWRTGKSADIAQCQRGCCDLPSGASVTTQAQCANKVKVFPDVKFKDIFKPGITDQVACSQQSKSGEQGCCVLSDQCKFGTRKECNDFNGKFNLNTLCSAPSLGCQVTAKHSTICYDNKVYWADSSGNKENVYDGKFDSSWSNTNWMLVSPETIAKINPETTEEIANSGNCVFSLGTTCDQVTNEVKNYLKNTKGLKENDINKVQNQCISLDCKTTKPYPNIKWSGQPRKNGESWCIYDSVTGNGTDLVGSRQYVHKCQNGVEVVDECQSRRSEVCYQNEVPGKLIDPSNPNQNRLYAKCVPNNWQLCLGANSADETCGVSLEDAKAQYYALGYPPAGQQHPVGPCDLLSEQEDKRAEYNSCVLKTICRKQSCEEQLAGNCYFNKNVGLCAPTVPPGTLGKEGEFSDLTNGNTIGFSFDAKMTLVETAIAGHNVEFKEDCKANCDVDTNIFANAWNSYCTSLGDLGAKQNIVGKYSDKGFSHTGPFDYNPDDINFDDQSYPGQVNGAAQGIDNNLFKYYGKKIEALKGNIYALLSAVDHVISNYKVANLGLDAKRLSDLQSFLLAAGITYTGVAIIAAVTNLAFAAPVFVELTKQIILLFAPSFVGGPPAWAVAIVTIAIIIIVAFIIKFLFGENKRVDLTYKLSCKPWVPPDGGQSCKECNDKSKFDICDEYKCKSLGKGCKLLNEGSPGNETCVWVDQGDLIPPIIGPLVRAPFTNSDIQKEPESTGFIGGYKFKNPIEAFTSIEVGIKIEPDPRTGDPTAECKISRDPRFDYEDSGVNFFEDSLTKTNHVRRIPIANIPILPGENNRIELEANKVNTFYVKCKDANGNVNLKSYFIEIPVKQGPDTAPPEIKSFSIKNNAPLPYNLKETPLTIQVEDQSLLEGCKYSTVDQGYSLMPNIMSCSNTRNSATLQFTCSTTLTLKPNQENIFYFRCNDSSGNINPVSMPPIEGDSTIGYHLFSSKLLKITQAGPTGKVLTTDVNLTITTSEGAENGKATCYYSLTKAFAADSIKFSTTDVTNHETVLSLLNEKDYKFFLWCRDVAGNEDSKEVSFHTTTPEYNITQVIPNSGKFYTQDIQLKVTTIGGVSGNGDGTCRYDGAGPTTLINDDKITTGLTTTHYKNITLQDGKYGITITCTDQYKSDTKKLKIEINTIAYPRVIRLYKQGNLLSILFDEPGSCRYTTNEPNFNYDDVTTTMVDISSTLKQLSINSNVFYIQCKSINTNQLSPIYTVYP